MEVKSFSVSKRMTISIVRKREKLVCSVEWIEVRFTGEEEEEGLLMLVKSTQAK